MTTCQWCGDRHGVDQLCQRAQRGMTRRSFCFMFGAGVAGAMVAAAAPVEGWYVDAAGRLHVEQANQWTVITDSLGSPSVATFKSSNPILRAGQRVAIDYNGQRLFEGVLTAGRRDADRLTAVEYEADLRPPVDLADLLADVRSVRLMRVP